MGTVRQTKTGFEVVLGLMHDRAGLTLESQATGTVLLGSQTYVIPEVTGPLSVASWMELLDRGSPTHSWRFVSTTPIVFRSGAATISPTAGLVFGHLRAVWAAFCPDDLRATFEGLRLDGLFEAQFDGSIVPVGQNTPWGRVPGSGFVGACTIVANCDDDSLRLLDTLASLVPFTGLGAATPFGCGVTTLQRMHNTRA
jgi:CRISPR/Cas system endoribonuclease Cas6 (RAMP superfamily)